MNEFNLIARYFAPLSGEGAFGLKDDAAIVAQRAGHDLIVSTDTVSEGTDFLGSDPPETIAQKALRVNLSDLAAKGAAPAFYLLNLTLPHDAGEDWVEAFALGLKRDQEEFALSLLGGDLGAGPLSMAVTLFGFVPKGGMVKRSGARVGDAVYVTGTIGDSAGGLALLKGEAADIGERDRAYLLARYRVPEPPVAFGQTLHAIAHAAVDVSDGLIADLGHVAEASGVRIVVDGERVPLSPAVKALWGAQALARAVAAGDDYQIAFAAPAGLRGPFTPIGQVQAGQGVRLTVRGKEIAVAEAGYRHF